ncbi:MAG: cyclic nucleotide-binding domain-containing protein [Anaerolineales bacterium]|nr:cyclic nucleotide-binding domain-containing protein [Anaerolineales bacterium]
MFKTLETVPLFKGLDNNTLQLLEPLFETYSCSAREVIFEQGDPAHYLYLILEGAVEVRYKPYDGPPLTITNLEQGSIIGWSAVIGNSAYTSGAVCKEDCQAIRMSSRDLHELCAREPEAGRIILNLLAESVSLRWQDARDQIQMLLNSTVTARQCANSQKRKSRKEIR